jgi:hypothetical protein
MSTPTIFIISQSENELKNLIKRASSPMIAKRIEALLVFKRHETTGISKRDVAEKIGVNHNSIQK